MNSSSLRTASTRSTPLGVTPRLLTSRTSSSLRVSPYVKQDGVPRLFVLPPLPDNICPLTGAIITCVLFYILFSCLSTLFSLVSSLLPTVVRPSLPLLLRLRTFSTLCVELFTKTSGLPLSSPATSWLPLLPRLSSRIQSKINRGRGLTSPPSF